MHSFEKIMKAKSLLGLREKSSLKEIKNKYKNLMKKWHPDKHKDDVQKATQMSMLINEAYEIILDYCNNYEFSFDEEHIKKSHYSPSEWWNDKFGGR
ncbi:MAG: J domain-containing protein [Sulfurimonas sp.]|nr:J domain-containing protein [Sulfurimonas sp.]MBU1215933.1 J domain-containing protein [bacterium]MBU1435612.1 J domain-containing protein [bacterium]MBU1502464.1 J domain-containing protein [bacterium]MBU3938107.1 J domain-containing protein [bacterium]